jgi:phosphoenolpyruvate carboxylase
MNPLETLDKDLPLRYDIRLLGRILGDTVRSQEGEPVFAIVERIRRTSGSCARAASGHAAAAPPSSAMNARRL